MPLIDDPILVNDWHVLARSSDVPSGGTRAARLLGRDVVLWRSAADLHAWHDLCVHRGAKLSPGRVENDCLICPYHGWVYDAAGICTRIPAHPKLVPPSRARTTTYQVRERYNLIWVCLGEPTQDVPSFPEWDDVSYRKISSGPYRFHTYGPRILENFLDVAHLAHVHAGLLGDTSRPEIDDYEVELSARGVVARDIPIWQPNPDGSGQPGLTHYTYEVQRPLTASFVKKQGEQRFAMIDIVTPIEDNESEAWPIMAINYLHDLPDAQFQEFQDLVTTQDVPIVESQRPELLPLDLQAEMHLRSDRTAIAYRQWLRQIGLKHGTA